MKYTNLNKLFFFLVTEKCGWETIPSKKMARMPTHSSDSGKQMLLEHNWEQY